MKTPFTKTEQEIIVLKAIWELIDGMVNYEMFLQLTRTNDVQLMLKTMTHQRLFNILLVDFLSPPTSPFGLAAPPKGAPKSDRSVLFLLRHICDQPKLNPSGANILRSPLDVFVNWLEADCLVEKVWLPSIQVESNIRVKRIAFIKICGNIAKHSFTL
jgi:hypothetical protein